MRGPVMVQHYGIELYSRCTSEEALRVAREDGR